MSLYHSQWRIRRAEQGLQRAQSDWENEQQRLTKRIEELQKATHFSCRKREDERERERAAQPGEVQTDWRKEDTHPASFEDMGVIT